MLWLQSNALAGRVAELGTLGDEVGKSAKIIDVLGRLLLGWYLIQTARYFWIGRFGVEVGELKHSIGAPLTLSTAIAPLQVAVAAGGVFILIPLLWRGTWAGLVVGLLYWVWGYPTNPLQFVIPISYLGSPSEGPTPLLWAISLAWMATTLAVLIGFFLPQLQTGRFCIRHSTISRGRRTTSIHRALPHLGGSGESRFMQTA